MKILGGNMNNLQFNILRLIKEVEYSEKDQFARTLYKDHDAVNTAFKNLETNGFIKEGALTKKGLQEPPHRN